MTPSTSPILIKEYDPKWALFFKSESKRISCAIADFILSIEHIGSTAVPGLAAKPIVDILIGVKKVTASPLFIPPLLNLDYVYIPEYESSFPERRYLHKGENYEPAFHLHIVEPDTVFYKRHIAFRDYLRTHPETVEEYAGLKRMLAAKFGSDREGYTDSKTDFIKAVEFKALHEL